jgi:hypothetical protein
MLTKYYKFVTDSYWHLKSVFKDTTVGTSHLWTKICLKDDNEVYSFFFFGGGGGGSFFFLQEHDASYILDSFTFCTQIAGTDTAYNLKIAHTTLEGPTLHVRGSSAALTSSVHRATM